MEFLFEILVQLFLELIGPLLMEGVGVLISRFFSSIGSEQTDNSWFHLPHAIGAQLAGVFAGLLSLLIASRHIIQSPTLRFINLIVTPLMIAWIMTAWGRQMQKKNREKTPLNHFVCAYGFALCYLLVRFAFAR